MVHYFLGADTYAARQAITTLADKTKAAIRWLDQDDLTQPETRQLLTQAGSGLFGRELTVIRDPGTMLADTQQTLVNTLKNVSSQGDYILWDRSEPNKKLSVYKEYGRQRRQFKPLSGYGLYDWVISLARQKQVSINPDAARLLLDRVGPNRWQLAATLEQLALTCNPITVKDITTIVPPAMSAEIFSVLDALTRGQKAQTILGIKQILAAGASEFYVLSMFAYQFKTLFIIRAGIDKGKTPPDVTATSGLKPYSVQKNWRLASRQSAPYWRLALTRVLATDFSIRQGKIDARTGVLMLTTGLI